MSTILIILALVGVVDPFLFFPMLEDMSFEQSIGVVVCPYLVRNFTIGLITGVVLFNLKSPAMFIGMLLLRLITDIFDFGIVVLSGTVTGVVLFTVFMAFLMVPWAPTLFIFIKLKHLGFGIKNI